MNLPLNTTGCSQEVALTYMCPLERTEDVEGCGGKACNLGRMLRLGLPVPAGLVVTARAFQEFLDENELGEVIAHQCADLDPRNPHSLRAASAAIRERILAATIPGKVWEAIGRLRSEMLPAATLVVRSSAVGEDAAQASFAGQLDSFLHVGSEQALHDSLLACWASYWSERSLFYQHTKQAPLNGMGVVIQEQVQSRISGVLFTRNPSGGDDLVVEYCFGHGDVLVSGQVNPGRISIARNGLEVQRLAAPEQAGVAGADASIGDAQLAELARAGLLLEEVFGCPQDIEWTIGHDGQLYLVQTRPITVGQAHRAEEPEDIPGARRVVWSNANVNENFPEPIAPLLYSIASAGYYHYFRNLGLACGIAPSRVRAMEYPLRNLIGVHGARMYYNLTNIHAVLRQAPFGELLADSFNDFVGATPTSRPPGDPAAETRPGRLSQGLEVCRMALKAAWQFWFLPRRVAAFERTVSDFAERTTPANLEDKPLHRLLDDFRAFLDIRFHRWTNAALADAAAMVSYGLLKRLLNAEFPLEDQSALHNTLLKGLPDLVSSVPVARLWELSRRIREDPALADLFAAQENGEVLAQIHAREEFAGFRMELHAFLDDCGFRCSGELMLTVPTFQEKPTELLEILRAYAALQGESPLDLLRRQDAERTAETAWVLKVLGRRKLFGVLPWPRKALLVQILLNWTHRSIALRERARLKQALLYSRCRRIALAIGGKLVALGRLEDRGDIFYLTYQEIDSLLTGTVLFPYQVKELIGLRKTGHANLSAMTPPDSFELTEGSYLRLADPRTASQEGGVPAGTDAVLSGVGACGGQVTAPAALLKDLAEFGLLAEGDVLVTRQTDPGWGPVFFLIKGLVIERGGMLSHGAILAREFGIPAVVGVKDATRRIAHGQTLWVNGDRGVVQLGT